MSDMLRQRTAKGFFWSGIERIISQGVVFLLGLVTARLLTPQDYGTIALLYFFLAIAGIIISSGISSALIRKTERTETDHSTVFWFVFFLSAAVYLILFFVAPLIAGFYELPLLAPLLRVTAVGVLFEALGLVPQSILMARIDFKTQARITLPTALVSGLTGITFAWLGFEAWALAAQYLSFWIVRAILLWIVTGWKPAFIFSGKAFTSLFSFGSRLMLSELLDTFYRHISILVIGKVFSPAKVGFFSRADQFAKFPSSTLTEIFQRVAYPVLSSIRDEDERLSRVYRKMIRMTGFVAFPLMIWLAVVARPLITALLTEKWIEAAALMQIICLSAMWFPIQALNLNLLKAKGRSDLFLKLEVIKKTSGIAILCATIPAGLMAVCWGMVVNSVFALIVNTHYTGKLIRVGFIKQTGDLLPILFQSFAMGWVTAMVLRMFDSLIMQLAFATLTALAVYFFLSLFLAREELKECKELIKWAVKI